MGAQLPKPIHVFVSYAREDEALKDELLKHLRSLKRSGALAIWHNRDLDAGDPLQQTEAELDRADVVLLLLSVDYIASDELHDREMMRAIGRRAAGAAKVIPIFLRPISIEDNAPFAGLTALPSNQKPIATWPSRDEAWNDVVRGLRRELGLPAAEEDEPDPSAPPRDEASAARVEIAKSRDRMIIVVVTIVAVTTIFVRTSGAPTPYLAAVTAIAVIGASGSAIRHALRSRKLAVVGAGGLAGAAVLGTSAGASAAVGETSATGGLGSIFGSLLNAATVGIAAAAAGVGIGLGVEGGAAAVKKHGMPSELVPTLNSPFDEITSLLAADAGTDADAGSDADAGTDADADADADAGTDPDAGALSMDAGSDASQSTPIHHPTGSVDLATFKKNAANAVASAQKEATATCLRPGVSCSGRISFTPEGIVGAASITCKGSDGRIDTTTARCALPIFKKHRIPPLAKPSTSPGVDIPVGPFSK